MSGHAHRARRPVRRRVTPVVGALLILLLGTTPIAVARFADDGDRPSAAGGDRADAAVADLGAADASAAGPSATAPAGAPSTAPALPVAEVRHARPLKLKPTPEPSATQEPESDQAAKRLADRAEQQADEDEATPEPDPAAPFTVRIGSFNVLGSQHTAPGGDRQRFPPASVRSVSAANLMAKHGVGIVGTQELQDDQLRTIQSRTGFSAYPGLAWGAAETDNSILYDADRFEFVSGSRFTITFMSRPRPQPILRLRERATGREFYVVNTHPSAHDGRYLVERRRGQATLVSVVNSLKGSGLPVLVTGDMNDREEFYCRVVPAAGLVASNGGSYGNGCRPPRHPIAVDWVVGGGGVTWSGYWRDTTPVTNRVSDHFFISATAHVG